MVDARTNSHPPKCEVFFPLVNKSTTREKKTFHEIATTSKSCGAYVPETGLFLVATLEGKISCWGADKLDLICTVQSHTSGAPIIALCHASSLVFSLQADATLISFSSSNYQALSEQLGPETTRDTILHSVGLPHSMCVCSGSGASPNQELLAICGKRSKSILILHADTLAPLHLLHGAADYIVACIASHSNVLCCVDADGQFNLWQYGGKLAGFGTDCLRGKLAREESGQIKQMVLLSPNTLCLRSDSGHCILAREFAKNSSAELGVVLSQQAEDVQFANECLYMLQRDGTVLIMDHYMTQRRIAPAPPTVPGRSLMIPGSCDGEVFLSFANREAFALRECVQVYSSKSELLASRDEVFPDQPLALIISPNRRSQTRYHAAICKQTAPGVLQVACFPRVPASTMHIGPAAADDVAYTCLECLEHQNGFFILAGRGNGQLDVFSLCLPLLAKERSADEMIELEPHKSLPALHLSAISAISLSPPAQSLTAAAADAGKPRNKEFLCTVDSINYEVAVLSAKDFTLVHRFTGHQAPISRIEWRYPFLLVHCNSTATAVGKIFAWNLLSGNLERIQVLDASIAPSPRPQQELAMAGMYEFNLVEIAQEMNGLESRLMGKACCSILSLLHKWDVSASMDELCQSVFGFMRPITTTATGQDELEMFYVERARLSSTLVKSYRGDACWTALRDMCTKHMLQLCSMYYLLSQYEPNFQPLYNFYCAEFLPARCQGRRQALALGGGGDDAAELSLECLAEQLSNPRMNHTVVRVLMCHQLDRLGVKRRHALLEQWSARLQELRRDQTSPSSTSIITLDPAAESSFKQEHHRHRHQLKRELSTLEPVLEDTAVDLDLKQLLEHHVEFQHLVLLLAICCVTHMEELSPKTARMVTEALVESVCLPPRRGIDSYLAAELLGLGFVLFHPHIPHMSRLIRNLLHLLSAGNNSSTSSGEGDAAVRADSVRHLLKRIGLAHPVLCIRTIGSELLDVSQSAEFRVAVTDLLVHFSRDEETAVHLILKHLVLVVEMLMKTLDPHDAVFRRQCFSTSCAVLQQLVKRFPMCAFHQTSQRFALGTLESTIFVYDVRTATKLKILDGSVGACNALTFDQTGDKLASYSIAEQCVRVWTTHGGFLDSFQIRGTLLAKYALPKLDVKLTAQQMMRSCRLSWDAPHEVRLRRENNLIVAIKV